MFEGALERHPGRLLPRLILAGFALRVVLVGITLGTNDIGTWYWFAQSLAENGLESTYLEGRGFNHPPLMGLWSVLALWISEATPLRFPVVLKIPSVVAEAVTAWLL